MKWVAKSTSYDFLIEEKEGQYDLNVDCMGRPSDRLWFNSLEAAKAYVKREFKGIAISRWVKTQTVQKGW
jgi:hypothetical protein